MRYCINVNGQTFETTVDIDGLVRLGDRTFSVDIQAIDDQALFSLLIDHESYELVMDEQEEKFRVLLRGEMYDVGVQDGLFRGGADWRRKSSRSTTEVRGEHIVRAPLPGLVVQVPVAKEQDVAEGEILVVLESMKMENELLAPRSGCVKEIHVAPGDTPNLGEPLVTLE